MDTIKRTIKNLERLSRHYIEGKRNTKRYSNPIVTYQHTIQKSRPKFLITKKAPTKRDLKNEKKTLHNIKKKTITNLDNFIENAYEKRKINRAKSKVNRLKAVNNINLLGEKAKAKSIRDKKTISNLDNFIEIAYEKRKKDRAKHKVNQEKSINTLTALGEKAKQIKSNRLEAQNFLSNIGKLAKNLTSTRKNIKMKTKSRMINL